MALLAKPPKRLSVREQLKREGLYRVSEASLGTGIPQTTIYRRLEEGTVKGRRVGGPGSPATASPRRKGAGIWYVDLADLRQVFGLAAAQEVSNESGS